MIRFIAIMIIAALGASLLLHFLPWWTCMVICFLLVLMMPLKPLPAILSTGIGTGLCWLIIAMMRDFPNEHIMSKKIALLIGVPSWVFVILIAGIIGFITGGLGGFSAAALVNVFKTKPAAPQQPEGTKPV